MGVEFITAIAPAAQRYHRENGIFASITIAQAILESAWGKATPPGSNNYFGIKGTGPAGYVEALTWEVINGKEVKVTAKFRKYNTIDESIADHNKLLLNARYAPVRAAATYHEAATRLQQCGYATDPHYATKLIRIIDENSLNKYDQEGDGMAGKSTKPWMEDIMSEALQEKLITSQDHVAIDPAPKWFVLDVALTLLKELRK